jgi:hypothetical protein
VPFNQHCSLLALGFRPHSPPQIIFKQGERDMGDKGKKIKAKGNNKKRPSLIQRKNEN